MSSTVSAGLTYSAPSVHRIRGISGRSVSLSHGKEKKRKGVGIVCAVGDVSSDGTVYLIAGAAAVALVGTAFPLFFSRKDLCPECDGAGFIRKSGSALSKRCKEGSGSDCVP